MRPFAGAICVHECALLALFSQWTHSTFFPRICAAALVEDDMKVMAANISAFSVCSRLVNETDVQRGRIFFPFKEFYK